MIVVVAGVVVGVLCGASSSTHVHSGMSDRVGLRMN